MITQEKSLSMAESTEYLNKEDTEIKGFIKKFIKITPEKAKKLRKEIESLDLLKVKPEHISKIIDLMPDTAEELNKIFVDVSLNEDESKQILEKTKSLK